MIKDEDILSIGPRRRNSYLLVVVDAMNVCK